MEGESLKDDSGCEEKEEEEGPPVFPCNLAVEEAFSGPAWDLRHASAACTGEEVAGRVARHSSGRVACHTAGSRAGPHVANVEEEDHRDSRSSVATVGFSFLETEVDTLKKEADTGDDGKEVAALCSRERRLCDRWDSPGTTCLSLAQVCGLVVCVF